MKHKKTKMAKKFDVSKHILVPKHKKISETKKKELIDKYKIVLGDLPKIMTNDPALEGLGVKAGDIVEIIRKSPTAGETSFYRRVSNA